METKAIKVYTTVDDKAKAQELAALMVEKRLAACAQVSGPISSTYWWQGQVETEEEWQCIFKTRQDLFEKLENAVKAAHSYDTPAIIAIPLVGINRDYLEWLIKETEG